MIGETIGKYEVFDEVGQGGMSVVYRGRDTVLDRSVAVKVLHPHLSRRAESRQRFEREARAIAKLHHSNIVQVYDFSGTDSERAYIIMEFIAGCTLRDFMDTHTIRFPEISAMVGVEICGALEHAHSLGIIHRDIKPENVMIGDDGAVKLTDFGIAQMVDAQAMTVTGTLLGSPAHMSPEMIEGLPMDFRADIFSLGTVLYYAATGKLPFSGKNAPLVLKAILEGDYLDAELANPIVGRRFARIIDRCLARDPDDRYQDVAAVGGALLDYLDSCGLSDDIRAELAAFIPAPDAYQDALEPRLVESLERAGTVALESSQVAAALAYYNRVLAIQPDNEAVLRQIRRIDLRRKTLTYVGAAAALLAVVALVAAINAAIGEDPSPDPQNIDAGAVASMAAASDDSEMSGRGVGEYVGDLAPRVAQGTRLIASGNARVASSRALAAAIAAATQQCASAPDTPPGPNRDTDLRRPDAGAAAPQDAGVGEADTAAHPVRIVVKVFPLTTNLSIAGTRYTVRELNDGVTIPRGSGLVHWEAECPICAPRRGVFKIDDPDRSEYRFPVRLPYRPAELIVNVPQDPGATVMVRDGAIALATGGAGSRFRVGIPASGVAERRVNVMVVPRSSGWHVLRLPNVLLQAGRPVTIAANLQRKD